MHEGWTFSHILHYGFNEMNFLLKLFRKRPKKYACNACHDGGMIQVSEQILHIRKYVDGTRIASFIDLEQYRLEPCPSKCEIWKHDYE